MGTSDSPASRCGPRNGRRPSGQNHGRLYHAGRGRQISNARTDTDVGHCRDTDASAVTCRGNSQFSSGHGTSGNVASSACRNNALAAAGSCALMISEPLSDAVRPSVASIELGNEHQPTAVGGMQVAGQLGDPGRQFADRRPHFNARHRSVRGALRRPVTTSSNLQESLIKQ